MSEWMRGEYIGPGTKLFTAEELSGKTALIQEEDPYHRGCSHQDYLWAQFDDRAVVAYAFGWHPFPKEHWKIIRD